MIFKNSNYAISLLKGILATILVLIFGFGVMYVLWINSTNQANLPGLFYYRASTYGDSICLPLLTGLLIAYISMHKKATSKQRTVAIIVGAISALVATIMQASWQLANQ